MTHPWFKEKEAEKEAAFLQRALPDFLVKRLKLGYTIFSHCRRWKISSAMLQTHNSKATFLSESHASKEQSEESEEKEDRLEKLEIKLN